MEREKKRSWRIEGVVYAGVFLITLALFFIVKPRIDVYRTGIVAQSIIALVLLLCVALALYWRATKALTTARCLCLLLCVGYVLRVGYMLYTTAATRQHDTYTPNFDGHEAYAWTLFESGKLPTSNVYQFYHPPLNAFIQAGFMKCVSALTGVFGLTDYCSSAFAYGKPEYIDGTRWYLYSSCQVLSVTYSFIAAAVLVKTVWLFSFSKRTKLLVCAFVLLYPRQIQFAGMLNNDGVSYLFSVLAIYYALKWQKGNKGWGYLISCAVSVGLGMTSKLSSATVCLPIAGIFLYEFIRTLRKKEGALPLGQALVKYGVFLLVCAPIGLWFQIYAAVRFEQGFGFVFSNLNAKLYTGDRSWFSRFIFTFDLSEYFGSIYCRPFDGNYFLFNYALRSSIFGEFTYWQGEGFAVAAVFTAYMGTLLLAASLTWSIASCVRTRGKIDSLSRRVRVDCRELIFIFLLVQSQVLSEIYFYIKMPYGCTMDFRYVMPMILGVALTWGQVRELLLAEGGRTSTQLRFWTDIAICSFLAVSALFYCVCI